MSLAILYVIAYHIFVEFCPMLLTHRESRLRDEVVDRLEDVAGVHVVVVGVAVARVASLHVHQHRLHRQRGNLQQENRAMICLPVSSILHLKL